MRDNDVPLFVAEIIGMAAGAAAVALAEASDLLGDIVVGSIRARQYLQNRQIRQASKVTK